MVDMSQFVAAKTDQLGAEDLLTEPRTITITRVTGSESNEQPVNIYFRGDGGKPWRPCKTARRLLLRVWGRNAAEYVGRSLTIYRDDTVKFGGLQVGGIRISHMSHIDAPQTHAVLASQKKMQALTVKPLLSPARNTTTGGALEEAPAIVPESAAGEPVAPAAGLDLGEPDYMARATELDAEYRLATTLPLLQAMWADTAADRKMIIAADPSFKEIFVTVLGREKARIEAGEQEWTGQERVG